MKWGPVLLCIFSAAAVAASAGRDHEGREAFKKAKKLVTKGEYASAEKALLKVKSEFGDVFADPADRFTRLASEADAELLGVRCLMKRPSFEFTERKWEDMHRRLLSRLNEESAEYAAMMKCGFILGPEGRENFWSVSPLEGQAPSVLKSVLAKYDWRAARTGTHFLSEKGLDVAQSVAVPDPADPGKIAYFTFLYHKENGWGWKGLRADGENLRALEATRMNTPSTSQPH